MHLKNCVRIHSFNTNEKLFKRQVLLWVMHGAGFRTFLVCTNEILPQFPEQRETPPVHCHWTRFKGHWVLTVTLRPRSPNLPQTTVSPNNSYNCQWGNNQQGLLIISKTKWATNYGVWITEKNKCFWLAFERKWSWWTNERQRSGEWTKE